MAVRPRSERTKVTRDCGPERRTKQAFAAECDIMNMIRTYQSRGVVPAINPREPLYGDFTGTPDLATILNKAHEIQENFKALPAYVRDAAQHDPVEFMAMFDDVDGREILIEAGANVEHHPDWIAPEEPEPAGPDPQLEPEPEPSPEPS